MDEKANNTIMDYGWGEPTLTEFLGIHRGRAKVVGVKTPKPSVVDFGWAESPSKKSKLKLNYISNKDFLVTKDYYEIKECLNCFKELYKKNIGEIYLTGSVALYLQGKISRSSFKDIDLVIVGKYELDDDIYSDPFCRRYPPDMNNTERSSYIFNNVKLDIFSGPTSVNSVNVEYNGDNYLCQDYRDIIKAKLNMVLPKVKDLDELLGKSFEITYK